MMFAFILFYFPPYRDVCNAFYDIGAFVFSNTLFMLSIKLFILYRLKITNLTS